MTAAEQADAGLAQRVVRGGAIRAVGFLASNLFAAAGAVLVLRHLGVSDFGRFGSVMAVLAIVQGVTDAGLSATATRELALLGDDDAGQRRLLGQVIGARILTTAVGVVVAMAFVTVAGYGTTLVEGTLIAGVGIFLGSVQAAIVLPLTVELRNGLLTVNELVRQGTLAAAFAVLVALNASLLAFFGAQLAVGIVALLVAPLLVGRRWLVRPRFDLAGLRTLVVTALPVAIAAVIGVIYFRILVVIVFLLLPADPTGYYNASTRIFELVAALPALLSVVVLPVLSVAARDDEGRLGYVTQRLTEVLALGGAALALGLAIAAEPVLRIVAGDAFLPAAPVLQIQCIALTSLFISASWAPVVIGIGAYRALIASGLAGLVTVAAFGILLTSIADEQGAAAAAVLGDLAQTVTLYIAMRRAGAGQDLDLRFLWRLALAVGVAGGVALLLPVPALVAAVAAEVLLLGAALALRLVPPEVLTAARLPARA